MNKLPTKQIYLLTIIIVGIIALSVYSTYALFTFESSTSDVVVIHTPKSLKIKENVYEYQQIEVDANTITTTDIDIYNGYEYEVCYSAWYQIIGSELEKSKIQLFEHSDNSLLSSGILPSDSSVRTKIVIINDNDTNVKINIGTIGKVKKENSCSLDLSNDRHVIDSSYKNIEKLTNKLLEDNKNPIKKESGYITYNNQINKITYKDIDNIYISDKFDYKDETFTLKEPTKITLKQFIDEKYLEKTPIYICQNNEIECNILYKITAIETEKLAPGPDGEEHFNYHITKYDKLIGYLEGENGLRKINEKDYIFYGDNPNNFMYYNCENNSDISTCEIWRIIGFFYNDKNDEYKAKIIRNDSIGKYQFDSKIINDQKTGTNIWKNTTLYKYLTEEYWINNDIYTTEYKQQVERINSLDNEINKIKIDNEFISSKISLLNLSDYLYASACEKNKINEYTEECLKNNWLNNIEIDYEWTITAKENIDGELEETLDELETEENIKENIINYVYSVGSNIKENNVNELLEIRPVVFLKSRMLFLEGNGSLESPYIVK